MCVCGACGACLCLAARRCQAVLGKFTEPIAETVVFVDVDFDSVNTPFQDYELLPKDLLAPLKTGVARLLANKESNAATIARPFADFFVALIGNYRKYIRQDPGSSTLGQHAHAHAHARAHAHAHAHAHITIVAAKYLTFFRL